MITNYSYYTGTYRVTYNVNKQLTEDEFNFYIGRAEKEVAKYLNIKKENLSSYISSFTEDFNNCCCSLCELFNKYSDNDDKTVKGIGSESVSGYSVSYTNTSNNNFLLKIRDEINYWLDDDVSFGRGVGRHVL